MKSATVTKYYNILISVAFFLVILAPPLKMAISPAMEWSDVEKRKLADFPAPPASFYEVDDFFRNLETYCNDNFGFRDFFIYRYFRELRKRFDIGGLKNRVLEGKDGWLFFAIDALLKDFQGKNRLTEKELERWLAIFDNRYGWLKSRNIDYLLVVPPNKQSIYLEYLPADFAEQKGTSRYRQLLDHVASSPPPYLVDLQKPLLRKKEEYQLFQQNDTHWNTRGAFVGFQEIIATIQGLYPDLTFTTDFSFSGEQRVPCTDDKVNCDLAKMAMRQDESIETVPLVKPFAGCGREVDIGRYGLSGIEQENGIPLVQPFAGSGREIDIARNGLSEIEPKNDAVSIAKKCDQKKLKVLVFHDSFMEALEPYLSENFGEAVYLWKNYDQVNVEEILASFKPDLVIEEILERDLFNGIN